MTNLLRLSGLLFTAAGAFHTLRFFFEWEFRVGGFELTRLGSLIAGVLLLALAGANFAQSRK